MQLKKLEMCGFKSFANRTEIAFQRGVTGIVGPNGCGKSNVVDAIKWVLGTLSYKSVRGEEMMDVIFKGAEGVPPMGFAEVSLTLDNSDHSLPLEFEEVTITRRLFNTGQGEFYINRAACRLRDIRELLYGTGIGADNYSVIEQGKIDKLVLSNPHERRLVFDEAAGISKYRAKKKETEHRLDKVSQDLLRIQDVVHEVQKQLRSVRAQAGRAARYRELQGDHKAKRLRVLVHDHRTLADRGRELAARVAALSEERERLRAGTEERTRSHEEARRRLEEETARHAEAASVLAGLESQAAYLEKAVASAEARRRELEEESRRIGSEGAAHRAREAEIAAQIEGERRAKAELDAAARARAAEADEIRQRLEDAARECARVSEDLEGRKHEAVELAHKEAQYRNERDRLERDHADLEARAAQARARGEKLEAELGGLRTKLEGARAEKTAIEAEIAGHMERKRVEDAELARLRAESAQLEKDLVQLREGKDHRVARRETLRDLEEQFEGLEGGARTLLRERPEGVLGAVADFLEVAPEHVAAIEGALGERAGAVVCATEEHARRVAALLRERGLGRTLLLSLDECRGGRASDVELLTSGALARANDRVRAAEGFEPMAATLLGRTLVVQDAEHARAIRRSRVTDLPLVTPEGDAFEAWGLVTTGGARAGQGLISRKAELRRLEDEIGQYLQLITQREGRRAEVEQRIRVAEEKIEHLRQQVYEQNVALGETASRIEQLAVREQFLADERGTLAGENDALARQARAVSDRAAAIDSLLAELAWVKNQVAGEIASLAGTLERYEKGRAELQNALTHARVECAKANEQRLAVEKRLEMLAANLAEAASAAARVEELLGETAGRLETASGEIRRAVEEREALSREAGAARERVGEAARRREERAAESEAARAELGRVEGELGPCEEELNRLRVEEEGVRVKAEALALRAREELEADLAETAASAPPEEGADWEALGREVEELRIKIAGFGAVNVVALDQLAELEEREKFLLAQQEDLVRSKAQMEDLIRQLNKESRELFDRTIEVVREHFSAIFRKVFGGGKADLIVEQAEGVDPMEQGLEVMARPPQKELTTISLLSGGERSLTAIALVMALFRANPSPFCLLDEADAALDEKNVDRYAGLVREFAADTQFIVITHNKRTMAVADALYGVTMETPGVSKRVTVSLTGDGNLELLKAKALPPAAPSPAPGPSTA